jgi:hypothetical protein
MLKTGIGETGSRENREVRGGLNANLLLHAINKIEDWGMRLFNTLPGKPWL